ncbi:MAG: hypothetical protein OXH86_06225 [Acidimicrobiaceae bacterium]|nr:hypothetical protein [Acidimicrobiaceae bacterium]
MPVQPPPDAWLRRVATDRRLKRVRRKTIERAAQHLKAAGLQLALVDRANTETLAPKSVQDEGDGVDAALALLTLIAAELACISGRLLSGEHHYAGAALLRQVVEIEYLTWAFANGKRDADLWLNSTREERMSFFSPKKLRKSSGGRFEDDDYTYHCEQGGHPVPGASHLIGEGSDEPAQVLLIDLLLHSWRITDNVIRCVQGLDEEHNAAQDSLHKSQRALGAWGQQDPYYTYLCSMAPKSPMQ